MSTYHEIKKSGKNTGRDILVFQETDGNGNPLPDTRGLFAYGRVMAARTKGRVIAVYTDASSDTFLIRVTARALAHLIKQYAPYALLFSASLKNRALAGETAALTATGIVSDAAFVRVLARNGQTVWRRQSFGGYLQTDVLCAKGVTQIVLVTPGVSADQSGDAHFDGSDEVLPLRTEPADGDRLPRLMKKSPKRTVDLEHADVIVAGGRGVGSGEGFELIKELADALGGVVGASRYAVDQGWIGKECLVGQSGKTVKPRLYIACGISGSVQHISGMRNADCVVSVNTDKTALIFNVSDYCIVGDLFEVIPALIRQVKA